MVITLAIVGSILLLAGLNILFAVWFHHSTKRAPEAAAVKPDTAKLISKQEAWKERPAYDYQRTSMMGSPVSPIEPGDSDPPEPYE